MIMPNMSNISWFSYSILYMDVLIYFGSLGIIIYTCPARLATGYMILLHLLQMISSIHK